MSFSFSGSRTATHEDITRYEAAWNRFVKRHHRNPLQIDLDYERRNHGQVEEWEARRLLKIWEQAVNRALGASDLGLSHGYVGRIVE